MRARRAEPRDTAAIARVYNQGIEDRSATFEVRRRSSDDVAAWLDGIHPVIVVEQDGEVIAFAATSSYSPRECYAGIAEVSVYVDRACRGRGAGRLALAALIAAAEEAGFWKLLSRVFTANEGSRALVRSLGFREVGVYQKHARLDGRWTDVVIVERLLDRNL